MDGENIKKQDIDDVPHVKREGWDMQEIAEQAVNETPDEIVRKVLRGDEERKTEGDEEDIAGGPARNETPQRREQSKLQNRVNSDQ